MRETNAIRQARAAEVDPYKRRFTWPKWNRTVTVCDVYQLFRHLPEFAGWTRGRHEAIAYDYLAQAIASRRVLADILTRYEKVYGTQGPLIAGGIRDHWPAHAKDFVRAEWNRINAWTDQSIAHWQAAGRRVATWREMRDRAEVANNG